MHCLATGNCAKQHGHAGLLCHGRALMAKLHRALLGHVEC